MFTVFYKRAVAALCRMVLADDEYVHQGQQKIRVGNKLDERAETVAGIVAHLCLGSPSLHVQQVIVAHLGKVLDADDYRDPGEAFTFDESVFHAVEEAASQLWPKSSNKSKGKKKKQTK
jgi:hypothetical protein